MDVHRKQLQGLIAELHELRGANVERGDTMVGAAKVAPGAF